MRRIFRIHLSYPLDQRNDRLLHALFPHTLLWTDLFSFTFTTNWTSTMTNNSRKTLRLPANGSSLVVSPSSERSSSNDENAALYAHSVVESPEDMLITPAAISSPQQRLGNQKQPPNLHPRSNNRPSRRSASSFIGNVSFGPLLPDNLDDDAPERMMHHKLSPRFGPLDNSAIMTIYGLHGIPPEEEDEEKDNLASAMVAHRSAAVRCHSFRAMAA